MGCEWSEEGGRVVKRGGGDSGDRDEGIDVKMEGWAGAY
jgi:hypothetical protein